MKTLLTSSLSLFLLSTPRPPSRRPRRRRRRRLQAGRHLRRRRHGAGDERPRAPCRRLPAGAGRQAADRGLQGRAAVAERAGAARRQDHAAARQRRRRRRPHPDRAARRHRRRRSRPTSPNPTVTVMVVETVPPVIYVMGEVNNAGPQPLTGKMDVLQALATAKGFTDFADTKNIVIRRGSQLIKFNYNDAVKGKGAPVLPAARRHHRRPVARQDMVEEHDDDRHLLTARAAGRRPGAARFGVLAVLLAVAPAAAQQSDQPAEIPSQRICRLELHAVDGVRRDLRHQRRAVGRPAPISAARRATRYFNIVPGGQLEFAAAIHRLLAQLSRLPAPLPRRRRARTASTSAPRSALRRVVSRRLTLFARDNFADTSDHRRRRAERRAVPAHRFAHQPARRRARTTASRSSPACRPATTNLGELRSTGDLPDRRLDSRVAQRADAPVLRAASRSAASTSYRRASLDERQPRPSTFQDAGGVVRLTLGPHTSASASGGFALLHDRNARRDADRALREARHRALLDRATVGAAFERQFVPSFGFGGSQQQPGAARLRRDAAAAAASTRRARRPGGGRCRSRPTPWSSTRSGCAPPSAMPLRGWAAGRSALHLHPAGLDRHRR